MMSCAQQGACRRGLLLYVWGMCACMLCAYVHVCPRLCRMDGGLHAHVGENISSLMVLD
jgi:hypothetical protein